MAVSVGLGGVFVVAVGDPFDAIDLFGPFESFDDAEVWADRIHHTSTWVLRVEDPEGAGGE